MAKKSVAVLDIGSQKISLNIGCQGINNIPQIQGAAEVYYDGFADGQWLNPDKLRDSVEEVIEKVVLMTNQKIKKLYIGVPGEFTAVVCKECALSFDKRRKINDNDLDNLFKQGNNFKSDNYVTVNNSAIYYKLEDGSRLMEPRGLVSSKLRGLVSYILCEKTFINTFNNILASLRIKHVEYIPNTWAEAMYLFEAEQRDKSVLLLDIGHISSSLMLVRGDGILNLSSFSMGGGHIAGDITMCLNIPYSQGEALKQSLNLSLSPTPDDVYKIYGNDKQLEFSTLEVNEIAAARIEALGAAVLKSINNFEYECPTYLPVYLTGGGISFIRGAKEVLSKVIGRPVEIVAPPLPQLNKPNLSSSLGLLDVAIKYTEANQSLWNKIFG